jgi:hypothetical protein
MSSSEEKKSEPDFCCKLTLDLRVREHRSLLPWVVAVLVALLGCPFFWDVIEKWLGRVG